MNTRSRNTARVRIGVGVVGILLAVLVAAVLVVSPGEGTDPRVAFFSIAAVPLWMLARGIRGLRAHRSN